VHRAAAVPLHVAVLGGDRDRGGVEVQALAAQRPQLTQSQPGERSEQHQGAVSGDVGAGDGVHLLDG
jgi:hypothetical protein